MGAVAGLVRHGLGSQAGPQPVAERHAADGLPVQHVVIGRAQRRGVPDRHLLLAMAEFRVVILHLQALLLQGGQALGEVVDHRRS